jgi:hypothetical protein
VTGQYRVFQAIKNMIGEIPHILPDGSDAPVLKPEGFATKLRSELAQRGMLAHHNGINVMSVAPESTILFVNWAGIWEIGNDFVPFKLERRYHAVGMHVAAGFVMGHLAAKGDKDALLLAMNRAVGMAPFLSKPVYHEVLEA